MKRTLLSMALFSAMVVMSSGVYAVGITADSSLSQFKDANSGLLIGPNAKFDGENGALTVTGTVSGESSAHKFDLVDTSQYPTKPKIEYAGLENQGQMSNVGSINASSVVNYGSLTITGDIKVDYNKNPAHHKGQIHVRNLDGATFTFNGKDVVVEGNYISDSGSKTFINGNTTFKAFSNYNGSVVDVADGVTIKIQKGNFSNGYPAEEGSSDGEVGGILNAGNATIELYQYGGGAFANTGTAVVGAIKGPFVKNSGALTINNSLQAQVSNYDGGTIVYNGKEALTNNTQLFGGAFYVSSGHLQSNKGVFIYKDAVLKKNKNENLDSLTTKSLKIGKSPVGERPASLVVNGTIKVESELESSGYIAADKLSAGHLFVHLDQKSNVVPKIEVRELELGGRENDPVSFIGFEGEYGEAQVNVHEKLTVNGGHNLVNLGSVLFDGDSAIIEGEGTIYNYSMTSDESGESVTTTGKIVKNEKGDKVENLVINATLNNLGEIHAKNLSVKNGYDSTTGQNSQDSVAFDVDNLTVVTGGDFTLNRTETNLQTITVGDGAKLTAENTINLSGNSFITNNGGVALFGLVDSDDLTVLGNNGQTSIKEAKTANQVGVTLDKGTVKIDNLETPKLDVTVNSFDGGKLDVAKANDDVKAGVTVSPQANKGAPQEVIDKVMDSITIKKEDTTTDVDYLITAKPGTITDGWTANSGDPDSMKTEKNPTMDAMGSVSALSALTLRHEMNSLTKRMGELRDAPAGVGVWARAYGSEMEFGDQNVKAKNNSVQMGTDYTLGDWKVGAAFSYTDGESSYDAGKADNKNYGLAVYGTWFVPCGAYVDLIAKYTRMDNDFTMGGLDGSFDNNAFNVSAETGYRFNFMDGSVFVEPQVGLSYGFIKGEKFSAGQGVTIEQDDYNSLIGRVGVRTGFKFPKDKGTIYARVSGVYDFDGEINARAYDSASSNTIESDLGGSWLEMGVGANFNWTKNTYTYVDFERTNGGDVKENYRWNVGVRYAF